MKITTYLYKLSRIRKFLINFSFRSAADVFGKLLGLITLPIITRALGPESYGHYNLVNIVVLYTSFPMALLGLRSYGIREIASNRKNKSYAVEILSMQLTVGLLSVIVSLIIVYFIFKSETLLFIAIVLGYILVFARAFDLEFFFISQKDLIFPSIAKIIGQLFYVLGVVLFIKEPSDFVVLVFLVALSPAIADIIQWKKYKTKVSSQKITFSLRKSIKTFTKTWQLGVSQNLEGFLSTIPQILLQVMIGAYALGIFSAGYKIYGILVMFYITFFYALAPYLVQLNNLPLKTQKKYHLLILIVSFSLSSFIGIILFYFGEPIVLLLLGKSFGESIEVFKVISLTLIPLTPVVMLLGNILIYSSHEKYYLISLIINGIVIVISAPLLINSYHIVGAVYSMTFSMIVAIIALFYFYLKINFARIS